ncbi:MAG: putative beta-lactamase [Clostridiales bacterium]|jgi:beta-lactamase class A|nr:putative beta-lactamase [Clostridiales bacterium]
MLKKLIIDTVDFERMSCSFVIKNLSSGELLSYGENEVISSASLIKIPIMGEVLRQVSEGSLSLEQRIIVNWEDKVPFSILTELSTGNSYTLKDLITLMIIQSDNTATNILIDLVGMDSINNFICNNGLSSTVLGRKMMDFNARKEGRDNYTTAMDMANILEKIYNKELVNKDSSILMMDILKKQLDNSMIRLFIPEETVIAHKTGGLDGIEHDTGIVLSEECDYIISVLTWNADLTYISKATIGEISRIVYDYFINNIKG